MRPPAQTPQQQNPATARRRKKSKKRQVPVPISTLLKPYLVRMYAERLTQAKDGGIFVLDHPGSVRKTFETAVENAAKMLEAAGLNDSAAKMRLVTPHTLRHTWATRAAQSGVKMYDIAGFLGDDEGTVRRTYAHHSPEYLRGAADFRERQPGANPGFSPDPGAKTDQQ
jgi:integrase